MNINFEQIETLKERANVSYEEAKAALEVNNFDIVESLIYLERQNKIKASKKTTSESGFFASVKQIIKKIHKIKFIIQKDDVTIINLPLTIMILITIPAAPIVAVCLITAIVTNHKIRFQKPDGTDMEINKTFDKVSTAVTTATTQIVETVNKDNENNQI